MQSTDITRSALQHFAAARHLHQAGHHADALEKYRMAALIAPANGAILLHLATILRQLGQTGEALELYRRLLEIEPFNAPVHNAVGQILAERGEWKLARIHLDRASAADAVNPSYRNNLANVLKKLGRVAEAECMLRGIVESHPKASYAPYNLAMLLAERGDYHGAAELFIQALKLGPENVNARMELAVCQEKIGRFVDAIEQYLAVLDCLPDHARAIANLLSLRAYRPSEELVARAMAIADGGRLEPDIAARLHQGIGKHCDAIGRFDEAFVRFSKCNELQVRPTLPPLTTRVQALIGRYPVDRFREKAGPPSPGLRPVFIVGMPRSGTTLVEQILSAHSRVFGAGELPHIPNLVHVAEFMESGQDKSAWRQAAKTYLNSISKLPLQGATHVTDKLPINFLHLGAIAKMFPEAVIVNCQRDHRDVAISCFIEMFASRELDLTSLDGLADTIIAKEHLMAHWRSVLPLTILDVDYGSLIDDFDTVSRRMFDHLGLEWQRNCRNYHELERAIDTPSRWQVRQPIYKTSRGRWRNYENMLEPLISRLVDAGLV